jgi:hypothetical protein
LDISFFGEGSRLVQAPYYWRRAMRHLPQKSLTAMQILLAAQKITIKKPWDVPLPDARGPRLVAICPLFTSTLFEVQLASNIDSYTILFFISYQLRCPRKRACAYNVQQRLLEPSSRIIVMIQEEAHEHATLSFVLCNAEWKADHCWPSWDK